MSYPWEAAKVGDQVYFDNEHLNNYDLYWTINAIYKNGTVSVEVHEMGQDDCLTINRSDIKYLLSAPVKKEKN
jgi:hypothetical protein